MTNSRIAIADIGSNSARMIVVQRSGDFGLIPVSESKVLLRLQRELRKTGELTSEGMERLVNVIKDFSVVAKSAGAEQLVTVATSAIRNTSNPAEVVRMLHEATGVTVRILSGEEEASYAFSGAISALPVDHGAVIDIGGGSMEIVRFENRRATQTVTLPLGALKLSDRFLTAGAVTKKELAKLSAHVEASLSVAGIVPLGPGAQVVGTGGTVRNAAKMDRRSSAKRFGRLHGHKIDLSDLDSSLGKLAEMDVPTLRSVSGLNPERADSIVGGLAALVASTRYLGGDSVLVSGAGLREGLALEAFGVDNAATSGSALQSVRDMCSRFATWDAGRASRRSLIAGQLSAVFEDVVSLEIEEALRLASELVDAGSTIDYYQRYRTAAMLVVNGNAGTLTHRQIALVSALCMAADGAGIKASAYGGEIAAEETDALQKSGVLLRLADEIEMRLLPSDEGSLALKRGKPKKASLTISFTGATTWNPSSLRRHYEAVHGGTIELSDDPVS